MAQSDRDGWIPSWSEPMKKTTIKKPTLKSLADELEIARRDLAKAEVTAVKSVRELEDVRTALARILQLETSAYVFTTRDTATWPEIYAKIGALMQKVDLTALKATTEQLSQQLEQIRQAQPNQGTGGTYHV